MPSSIIKEQRAEIITGVLTEGLMSATELKSRGKTFYCSNDGVGNEIIFGVTVTPPKDRPRTYAYRDHFERPLYSGIHSIFPVIAERPQDDDLIWMNPDNPNAGQEFKQKHRLLLQDRMASCLMAVFPPDVNLYQPYLPSSLFVKLLIPRGIWHDFKHPDKESFATKVMTSERSIRRRMTSLGGDFRVPDLEALLFKLLQENGELVVSGIRLPIDNDLLTYQPREEDHLRKVMAKWGW